MSQYIANLDTAIKKLNPRCTICGAEVSFFGFARPRKIIINGQRHTIPLRRVRCKNKHWGDTHVILPDFASPHKHYSVFDIELAVADMETRIRPEDIDCAADASTIRRWHASFKAKAQRLTAGLQAVLVVNFDRAVSEVATIVKTSLERLASALDKFPAIDSSDFLFSRSNLIISNFHHTHTLHGLTEDSFVRMWTCP